MEMIFKWDNKLLGWVQDAYLWFYDRTGIYRATICITQLIVANGLVCDMQKKSDVVWLCIFIALNGVRLGYEYLLQDKQKFEVFNGLARNWAQSPLRLVLIVLYISLMVTNILTGDIAFFIVNITNGLNFSYLAATQIRKREPPQALQLAPQASS